MYRVILFIRMCANFVDCMKKNRSSQVCQLVCERQTDDSLMAMLFFFRVLLRSVVDGKLARRTVDPVFRVKRLIAKIH